MTTKKIFEHIKRIWLIISAIIAAVGPLILLIGYISKFFEWGNKYLFVYFRDHYVTIWLISLTVVTIILSVWIIISNRQQHLGFSETFKGRLENNWDFFGTWKIIDEKLLITGADQGGITKKGSDWENYTLTFKAKITCSCLGVVVRARDLNNYYMLQINKKHIVPHLRASIPQIKNNSLDPINTPEIEMRVGWQIYKEFIKELSRELNDWFTVCVKVSGQSVVMQIDNEIVFEKDLFLQIPKGKIGFRCHGEESAQIKNVKVQLN